MPSSVGTTATSSGRQGERKVPEQDEDRSLEINFIRADGGWLWCRVGRGRGHVRKPKGKEFEKRRRNEGRKPAALPSVLGLPHLWSHVI